MQIIYFVPTYSATFEIKLKFWNTLKPDYHVPAVSVSWLVSQYRLQITTIFDLDWEAILGIVLVNIEQVVLKRSYPF